jgi:hypothetical protein
MNQLFFRGGVLRVQPCIAAAIVDCKYNNYEGAKF